MDCGRISRAYSPETLRPVMNIQAITYRRDAIYHDIHLGGRDQDHLGGIPLEGSLYRAVKQSVPTVKNVHLPSSGCSRFHAYIQIKKTAAGQGEKRSSPLSGRPPGQARRGGRRGHQYL